MHAALLCAALLCAASSPLHLARLSASAPRLLAQLCEVAVSPPQRLSPLRSPRTSAASAASDVSRRLAVQALTALLTNGQLRCRSLASRVVAAKGISSRGGRL